MSEPPVRPLSIRSLSFRYESIDSAAGARVFDNLSLEAGSGRTTVILGAADAGKTTLSRILVGAVPRFTGGMIEGEIDLGGIAVLAAKPCELMEHVGLVSQSSDEQIFTTRCDTEIAFALESLGVPRAEMIERVGSSLRLVDLDGKRLQNPSTLSGGEKKRLLVACLAAIDPGAWILDEALPELDRMWRARILDYLQSRGRTVLVLDSRLTSLHAERGEGFAVLSAGRISAPCASPKDTGLQELAIADGIVPAGGMTMPRGSSPTGFLRARGLKLAFPDSNDFSLSIESLDLEAGSVCSLLGRNGSGKSTLGRILCGLLPPRSGAISLRDGAGFRDASSSELNRRVGYLFQNPDHQIFLPTVFEELAIGLRRQGVGEAEMRKKVDEACEIFRLNDPGALPALMSFGARRRLQAATYFLLQRDFLILDEVDTGLSYRELISLFKAILSRPLGVLLITHDAALARSVSDRVLLMSDGRIASELSAGGFGALEQLLDEDGNGR